MEGTEYLVRPARSCPTPSACCSPPTPTPRRRSPRSTRSRSTTTCSSPGTRPRSSSSPWSRTCSTTWEAGAALEAGGVRDHRPPLLQGLARPARLPRPQPRARRAGSTSSATARRASCSRSPASAADRLPVALLEDGAVLERPSVLELAERLGVTGTPAADHYDLVIVGGGPAGLAAAVYGASEGLRTVMVEREAPGGQAGQSSRIENYLGFPAGLSGSDLARRATDQARRLGRRAADRPGRGRAARRGLRAHRGAQRRRRAQRATACSSPRASPTASSTRPASRSSPAPASTTAPR